MDDLGTSGGSLSLAELIDEHGSWLAADFLSEYGLRLADVLFEWPPREVLALVEVLSREARLWAHMEGGFDHWREFHGWGQDRHMFALWLDMYAQAHTDRGKKAWAYPRPAATKQAAQGTPLMALFPRTRPKGDT